VADALAPIADLAKGDRANLALRVAEHAIDRIEQAIEGIDDSDGHCGALLEQAQDIHLAACRVVQPDPVALAKSLFDREMDGQYDTFYRAAAVYQDVLGEAGLAEYRRLAEEAWNRLPPRPRGSDYSADHSELEGMLDFFAERDGNVDERIALRTRDLSSPWRYLQLARFCLQAGLEDEALRRAEEGLLTFEDGQPNEQLTLFAADLLAKAGRKADAEKRLWRAFEKVPSEELYEQLRKLAGTSARDRALEQLAARLPKNNGHFFGGSDLLVRLLLREKMFDVAWSTLEEHGGTWKLQEDLADASKSSHPDKAVAAYANLVEEHARFGRYGEAVQLIDRMAKLREPAHQITYLAELKERHRRKRNFMKLLQ
jgi:tetratricopeptide (TPR) repeat protein